MKFEFNLFFQGDSFNILVYYLISIVFLYQIITLIFLHCTVIYFQSNIFSHITSLFVSIIFISHIVFKKNTIISVKLFLIANMFVYYLQEGIYTQPKIYNFSEIDTDIYVSICCFVILLFQENHSAKYSQHGMSDQFLARMSIQIIFLCYIANPTFNVSSNNSQNVMLNCLLEL